ncbi:helix-turn-helix domain-containing protein [Palleronia sp. KMU-117]|uniref:helix-turn-helix domain-containing protein n=1 Tax=Palleronia sp. KMU-117 TaxID=3434108 RepID=UPI003D760FE8
MAKEQIPITPEVLRWARERAQFSIEELLDDFRNIEDWERGESFPTYPQLERLSETFKVPVAIFFFPEPPNVPPIRESFRTLPDVHFDALPREVRFLLRKAKALQINLSELNEGRNPAAKFILDDLRFDLDVNISEMAQVVRNYLNVPIATQIGWSNSEEAFDAWRDVLDTYGVAVFKDAFRNDFYSGFCLYDEVFPLIYVNNSVKTRQIFTLFHELSHLLFHTSGINTLSDEHTEALLPDDRRIEVICNQFAAEFLLPSELFEADTATLPASEETATLIANRYHVSRESVFRRFLDRGQITEGEYLEAAKRWSQQRQEGSGGNHYWTKIAYLGTNYINLAFSRYYQNRISEPQLADYLDTKVKNLPKLESYFARKVV